MEVSDLSDARDRMNNADPARSLLVGRDHSEDGLSFGEIPLHQEICDELESLVLDALSNSIDSIQEGTRALEHYDIANLNRGDPPVQFMPLDEFPYSESVSTLIDRSSFQETTYDEPRPDIQAIRLEDGNGNLLIGFREYTNRQVVSPSNKLRVFLAGQEYSRFEREVVTLPSKIDAMYLDGHIIVFNQKQFEDGFNYVDHFFDQSEDILDEIEAGPLNVTNMDDFRGWISNDRRKARKICQLSEFGIIDELDMSTATDIIDVHSLGLDITNGTGGSEISVPNGNKAWDMIKLLNNDHLVSPVNSEEFQATGGKRRPPE